MRTYRFHQFVRIERGPVNAAIIDLLTGSLFQVPVEVIDKFELGEVEDIAEFMEVAREEGLLIKIDTQNWIPVDTFEREVGVNEKYDVGIELHVEEGVDLNDILDRFKGYSISKLYFYGEKIPNTTLDKEIIELAEKNFEECIQQATIKGNFCKTQESLVRFNTRYNSCWGTMIAITADGKIRPCIHSQIEIGDINQDLENMRGLLDKFEPYWTLTKDRIETCRDCELRYICFDCREISFRESTRMYYPNPLCKYDPYEGKWDK
jgi:radical SAM protein with 4Fe4S-binding SPASM domain